MFCPPRVGRREPRIHLDGRPSSDAYLLRSASFASAPPSVRPSTGVTSATTPTARAGAPLPKFLPGGPPDLRDARGADGGGRTRTRRRPRRRGRPGRDVPACRRSGMRCGARVHGVRARDGEEPALGGRSGGLGRGRVDVAGAVELDGVVAPGGVEKLVHYLDVLFSNQRKGGKAILHSNLFFPPSKSADDRLGY